MQREGCGHGMPSAGEGMGGVALVLPLAAPRERVRWCSCPVRDLCRGVTFD